MALQQGFLKTGCSAFSVFLSQSRSNEDVNFVDLRLATSRFLLNQIIGGEKL